jgi:hypothetical protein
MVEPEPQGCVPSLMRLFFGMALIVAAAVCIVGLF